jgi:hypothetical protein
MVRVEEIDAAISNLTLEDCPRLSRWFCEFAQKRWADQTDRDSAADRLDFLFDDAGSYSERCVLYTPEFTRIQGR